MVVEGDTSLGIEDGGVVVAVEIGGDDIILSVADDTCGDLSQYTSKNCSVGTEL